MKFEIVWVVIAVVVISTVLFVGLYSAIKYENRCEENPRSCARNNQRFKCEDAGGLYFAGGYGAPNCTFPPK